MNSPILQAIAAGGTHFWVVMKGRVLLERRGSAREAVEALHMTAGGRPAKGGELVDRTWQESEQNGEETKEWRKDVREGRSVSWCTQPLPVCYPLPGLPACLLFLRGFAPAEELAQLQGSPLAIRKFTGR